MRRFLRVVLQCINLFFWLGVFMWCCNSDPMTGIFLGIVPMCVFSYVIHEKLTTAEMREEDAELLRLQGYEVSDDE